MKTKQFIKNMMARAAMTLLMLIAITMAVKAQDPLGIFCETTKTFYLTCGNAEEIRHSNKFLPEGSSDTLKVTCFYSGTNITATGNTPSWKSELTNYNTTTVVIESSFASVRPTSCAKWFNVSTFTDIQGIENLNTSEVTNMNYMFAACGISTLDLSSFNTEKVTNMSNMFVGCTALKTLDLSGFDTRKVTDMSFMFSKCSNLVSIIIGDGWNTSSVTSSNYMFNQCTSIVGYDGTTYKNGLDDKTKAHAGTGGYMCKYCPYAVYCASNKTLYFANVYRPLNTGGSFIPYGSTNTLTVTGAWSGTDVTNAQAYTGWMVDQCSQNVTKVVFEPLFIRVKPKKTTKWFNGFKYLNDIQGMEYLNTSEVTDMSDMFFECRKLTTLDLSHFDTEKVMSMSAMFDWCDQLTALDLETFNTSKVTDMESMFWECSNLVTIMIGDEWDTSKVTQSDDMFHNCTSIVGQFGTTYDRNKTDKSMAHARPGGYMCKKISPLTLSDNSSNTETLATAIADTEKYNVTLQGRTLYTDGDWSTLCLPFAISNFTGTPLEGFTVKELDTETEYGGHVTGFDGTTLYLNFKDASSIEAGKPYLVKKTDITETSATPTYTPMEGTGGSNWNQGYANLIDGQAGTGHVWRTSTFPSYCEFHTDQPFYVSGYKLTTGNQNAIGDPTVWTLKAKLNADDEWTVIDSRNVSANGSDALPSGRTKEKSYTVQHPGTYQYFYFKVSQTGGNYMCLTELALQCYNLEPVNVENPMFTGVTINGAAPTAVTSSDGTVSFMGGYSPVSLAANDSTNLYLGNGNTLCYPNANLTLGSCRAYLHLLINTSLGDVNGDGNINITDVIFMVNHILGQDNDDFIIANADMNQSGGIDISDVVLLVNKILSPDSSNKVTTVVSNVNITYDSSGSGSAR